MRSDRFDPRYFERDVLFRYHAGWAGLDHSRASPATTIDRSGILRTAGPDVPRVTWRDGRPYTLVEPGTTNLANYSEPSVADLATTDGDVTNAPGFSGLARSLHVAHPSSTSSSWAYIAYGGHTAGPLCFSAYVVMDDGGPPSLGIGSGADLRFFWAGSGGGISHHVEPMGGGVYLVWGVRESVESTGGNGGVRKDAAHSPRGFRVAGYAVEHGVERPSSLIRTDGAPATRDRDLVSVGYAHAPGSCAVLTAGREAGLGQIDAAYEWQIGGTTNLDARSLGIRTTASAGMLRLWLGSGSARTESSVPVVPMGAEYQRLGVLDVQGTEARVRLLQRYREVGGPWVEADGGWSAPLDVSELLAQGWESPHLTVGNVREGTRPARLMLSALGVLRGSHWTLDAVRRLLPW